MHYISKTDLSLAKTTTLPRMKPLFALLPESAVIDKPFTIREIIGTHFSADFHFHKECQLVYVAAGSGNRVIGNSVAKFSVGDLTFTGPNVPHVWYSDPQPMDDTVRSIALFINSQLVSDYLAAFVDISRLERLFAHSKRGLTIYGATHKQLVSLLQRMLNQSGLSLLSSFVQVLQLLADEPEVDWLNKEPLTIMVSKRQQDRVQKLMRYIFENFRDDISLGQAASVAGMQINAFCRFFKKLTQHTYANYINEVRIGFACRLLQESELSITQVAYEAGFSHPSYFNRTFKQIRGTTPRAYRRAFSANA